MTIQATAQWWIRTDGDDDNGGGFDSGISGAGTNYSDQATAQLDLTDLATASAGSTTLTSVTGGFTPAMIGNCVKIRSGTNVTNGYYFITAYTDTNTVTIDRACDNGGGGLSGGSGRLGGAWRDIETTLSTQAIVLGNSVASPLIAGHQVNLRGTGQEDGTTTDYEFTNWRFFPSGTLNTPIKIIGYNGRPVIRGSSGYTGTLYFYQMSGYIFENVKCICNGTDNGVHAMINFNSGGVGYVYNCIFDANGFNVLLLNGSCLKCNFKNSGSPAACTGAGINQAWNGFCTGNKFDLGNTSTAITSLNMSTVDSNLIIGGDYGIRFTNASTYTHNARNNIFYNTTTGIEINSNPASAMFNIFSGCTTAIQQNNSTYPRKFHSNAFYNCGTNHSDSGNSSGDIILTADPFVNAAGGDFNLNATNGGGAVLRSTSINLGS